MPHVAIMNMYAKQHAAVHRTYFLYRESIKCPGCHGDWLTEIMKIALPENE